MFDWLFEGSLTIYLLLLIAAGILLALWLRERKRSWLFALAFVAGLAALYLLLDRLVETPYEQIDRKLHLMAHAVQTRNSEAIFRHLAQGFSVQGIDRERFRAYVDRVLREGLVNELTVWDIQRPDPSGLVQFRAKPKGRQILSDVPYLVRGRFVRESDGQWRLESFQVFNPLVDQHQPMDIPQLPR